MRDEKSTAAGPLDTRLAALVAPDGCRRGYVRQAFQPVFSRAKRVWGMSVDFTLREIPRLGEQMRAWHGEDRLESLSYDPVAATPHPPKGLRSCKLSFA